MMKYNGYDIYGERLRVGYCSVHPNIHYEYPCPECRNEDDDRQAQFDAYKQHCIEQREKYDEEMRKAYEQNE